MKKARGLTLRVLRIGMQIALHCDGIVLGSRERGEIEKARQQDCPSAERRM